MPVERSAQPSGESTTSVQSLDRAFGLLERLADAGGSASISELAGRTGLPLPTIHRLIRSLVSGGYVRQLPSRRYALGPSLIRLGTAAQHLLADWALPHLGRVVEQVGESANLAVLDRDGGVYHYAGNAENPVFTFRLGSIRIASTGIYSLDRSLFRYVAPAARDRQLVRLGSSAQLA